MELDTFAQRIADRVTGFVGSWRFIIGQSVLLVLWITCNATGLIGWDPYPFILLNLLLSFQAAYTAPIIMMSQNRQAEVDREHIEEDFQLNREQMIELRGIQRQLERVLKGVTDH